VRLTGSPRLTHVEGVAPQALRSASTASAGAWSPDWATQTTPPIVPPGTPRPADHVGWSLVTALRRLAGGSSSLDRSPRRHAGSGRRCAHPSRDIGVRAAGSIACATRSTTVLTRFASSTLIIAAPPTKRDLGRSHTVWVSPLRKACRVTVRPRPKEAYGAASLATGPQGRLPLTPTRVTSLFQVKGLESHRGLGDQPRPLVGHRATFIHDGQALP